MLESLSIQGFRKYKNLKIDGLGKINFILGENNVGKTSVLEAVFALACGQNAAPFMHIPLSRGRYSNIQQPYWVMEELLTMVNDRYSIPLKMSFGGVWDGKEEIFNHTVFPSDVLKDYDSSYKKDANTFLPNSKDMAGNPFIMAQQINPFMQQVIAKWEIEHDGNTIVNELKTPYNLISEIPSFCSAKFIDLLSHVAVSENVQIYSALKREKILEAVVEELSRIYPEIESIDMIPYPDASLAPVSIVKKDGTILPMYAFGDGVQRWFYILGALRLYKNSIVCIDEVDTGLHRKAQKDFCRNIITSAIQNKVQLFMTTHNEEFLDNFLESSVDVGNDYKEGIRVITLRNTENGYASRVLNAEKALDARNKYGVDLRW